MKVILAAVKIKSKIPNIRYFKKLNQDGNPFSELCLKLCALIYKRKHK